MLNAMLVAQEPCICGHWRRFMPTGRPADSLCGGGPGRPRMGSIENLHGNNRLTYSCVGFSDSNSDFVFQGVMLDSGITNEACKGKVAILSATVGR